MVDLELLCDNVQTYLDTDPTYWMEDQAAFPWDGVMVFYTRLADVFILEVEGMEVICPRL